MSNTSENSGVSHQICAWPTGHKTKLKPPTTIGIYFFPKLCVFRHRTAKIICVYIEFFVFFLVEAFFLMQSWPGNCMISEYIYSNGLAVVSSFTFWHWFLIGHPSLLLQMLNIAIYYFWAWHSTNPLINLPCNGVKWMKIGGLFLKYWMPK